jgi:hypothetical protein
MKARWSQRKAAMLAIGMSLTLCVPVAGQINRNRTPQTRGNANQRRPAPRNFNAELKQIAESVAQRLNIRIVVDPALFVAAAPKVPTEVQTPEQALSALIAAIKEASWRRVYLTQAQANAVPPAEKLAASVRALDQLEQTGIVLEDPRTKRATTYLKNYSVSPNFSEELTAGQFSANPIYVIYSTNPFASAQSPQDRFMDLQKQQMEMMMNMSPEEVGEAMTRGMQLWNNLDPATRQQMMGTMMKAGMQMFQNMSPEQRNEMMQQSMQIFQQSFGQGGPGAGPGGRRP